MRRGKRWTPPRRRAINRAIRPAAASADITNGIAAASIGAMGVWTNPGQTVVTTTPRPRRAMRSPSM